MGLISRTIKFVVCEAARPALEEFGRRVGTAIGKKVGKRIDPTAFDDEVPPGESPPTPTP